jgi:hypothetical protein
VVAYVLFFIAGLGFGFAARGIWKLLPLLFPLVLFLLAANSFGIDAEVVLRLVVAILVTLAGVVLGSLLGVRGRREEQPRYA